jgi:hypothetical protein
MAPSPEILVEIPSPESSPVGARWWGRALLALASVAGLVVILSVTEPRVPPVDWTRTVGPSGSVNLDSLVATPDGFALLSGMTTEGVLLWSSTDGSTWRSQPLQDAPSQLAVVDDGLIAYSVRRGRMIEPTGEGWVEAAESLVFPDEVRSRQGSGRPSLIGTEDGMLAMSLFGDVWWSGDGAQFDRVVADPDWGPGAELPFDSVCRPPIRTSPDVPPMVVTDSGMVAMISSNPAEPFGIWPVCEPQLWFSDDGQTWTDSDSTLGDRAYVFNLGWRDGRFTAVGGFGIGRPAAWTSTDGRAWEPMAFFTDLEEVDLFTVESGAAGWVVLGRDSEGSDTVGWTSSDGLCWNVLPDSIDGGDAAVSAEHIIVFDRTTYPELWQGTTTGGNGACT